MTGAVRSIAAVAAVAAALPGHAVAEDLLQIYREALQSDPAIASARSNWTALQERLPQARAALLPNVAFGATAAINNGRSTLRTDPRSVSDNTWETGQYTISASQPLYRPQNYIAVSQAQQVVSQADFVLATSQQDLILRVAQAYFDALLAEFSVDLVEAQKAAVSEQLAQARRNFEVGVATITDTNEAQAKYDQIVANEIAARNDLDNKLTALRAIVGRLPGELKKLGDGYVPRLPEPNTADYWVERALSENLNVRIAQANYDIATLEVDRQRAAHLPTLDAVASFGNSAANGSIVNDATSTGRSATIGLSFSIPIYQGGFINSRVREALALQDRARQDLEVARRNALFTAQTGYSGVVSAVASVAAFEQALKSAQVAYESNKLGQEVGVRTNLDVLTVQQNVFQTRRDLAQAYFNHILGMLRLKSAVGTLNEQDLDAVNRELRG
jgi:outer membrane protein